MGLKEFVLKKFQQLEPQINKKLSDIDKQVSTLDYDINKRTIPDINSKLNDFAQKDV